MPTDSPERTEPRDVVPVPRLALDACEVAQALGLSARTIHDLTHKEDLPHARVGRRLLYPVADVERWLSERSEK